MPTYNSAYEIGSDIRDSLNEYSTALMQGTDTSGAFSNRQIMKGINDALRYLYSVLVKRIKSEFVKVDESITITSSAGTLPWDLGRLIMLKNQYGRPMYPLRPTQRVPVNATGSPRQYWLKKNRQIQIEQAGISETYLITYVAKPREIHFGMASAGGALSITLDASYAKKIVDYYNDMDIELVTDDKADTITDYTAARVATITNTGASDKYYGIVPEIPEAFHHLIAPYGAIFTKDSSPVAQEKSTDRENANVNDQLIMALRAFGGEHETDYDQIFTDFEPITPASGYIY